MGSSQPDQACPAGLAYQATRDHLPSRAMQSEAMQFQCRRTPAWHQVDTQTMLQEMVENRHILLEPRKKRGRPL